MAVKYFHIFCLRSLCQSQSKDKNFLNKLECQPRLTFICGPFFPTKTFFTINSGNNIIGLHAEQPGMFLHSGISL
jgi:hypothetical protein